MSPKDSIKVWVKLYYNELILYLLMLLYFLFGYIRAMIIL